MKALVAYASKHGATADVADAIGSTLSERGIEVAVSSVADVSDLERFDAVVLGSAVYAGKWLEPGRHFGDEHADALAARPTWLFSSGPIGDPPRPAAEDAVQIEATVARIGARGHRVFAGRLEKSRLGFGERAVMTAFRAPEGDFRDWDEIRAWAGSIADALESSSAAAPTTAFDRREA